MLQRGSTERFEHPQLQPQRGKSLISAEHPWTAQNNLAKTPDCVFKVSSQLSRNLQNKPLSRADALEWNQETQGTDGSGLGGCDRARGTGGRSLSPSRRGLVTAREALFCWANSQELRVPGGNADIEMQPQPLARAPELAVTGVCQQCPQNEVCNWLLFICVSIAAINI